MNIPFNQIYTLDQSTRNVEELINNPAKVSEKYYTKKCERLFEERYPGYQALFVGSCTRALELIAMSLDLTENDEVILPSFNYVGVANAFAQTGAKLVFADLHSTYMNLTLESIQKCISSSTKAVVLMNYAGVSFELEKIKTFCGQNNLILIEDNAQGIGAYHKGKRLGSFGDFSCISFDSLKNISCGEGGVLLFRPVFKDKIETIFHNGTNRVAFEKGKVDAYEWVSIGSKFAISEFSSAILYPLLIKEDLIIKERKEKWDMLYNALYQIEKVRPFLPDTMKDEKHNAHIFYLLFDNRNKRDVVMKRLQNAGIQCYFHYTPLHISIFGLSANYNMPEDKHTQTKSACLLRLPMFNKLSKAQIAKISEEMKEALSDL